MASFQHSKHCVLTTIPAFGHIRPSIGVVCKLIQLDPTLVFTIFSAKFLVPVIKQEIDSWELESSDSSRIRLIGIGKIEKPGPGESLGFFFHVLGLLGELLPECYDVLTQRGSLTCTLTGQTFDYSTIPAPCAVVFDPMTPVVAAEHVRKSTPRVKLVVCFPGGAFGMVSHIGPAANGGAYEWEVRTKTLVDGGETGSFDEIAGSIYPVLPSGKMFPLLDGVKMFDYENVPQAVARMPSPVTFTMGFTRLCTQLADAAFLTTARPFGPETTTFFKEWYEGLGKKLFVVGPQIPTSTSPYRSPNDSEGMKPFKPVFDFLDSHPPKSVLLISFGTMFYPSEPGHLDAVVGALLETGTPFIASRAAAMYQPLSAETEKRVEESGLGLYVDHVPQREILGHPSLAAFLTHGGANSTFESILAGVLNVFWPFAADQPVHACYMSQKLDCAWELVQVRTGEGARPPYRGGNVEGTTEAVAAEMKQILEEMKGSVGERKRKNLNVLRQAMLGSLVEGGETSIGLSGLSKYIAGSV